ncbi:polyprenyl synthetase family protein [Candidatus Kaiserbacteria bacterium]|nr:polyprenyl synthetase family protein [Candidatus Kaiserbacteria bacterium]
MKQDDPLASVGAYGARIDTLADTFLARNEYALYGMMRYFMGYADERFNSTAHPVGKRIRPGLLLLIADSYGLLEEAIPVALSIELFHNFTLIHDDIVDHDELRRGRSTVWKLWGVDHAINTGDAQLILTLRALEEPMQASPKSVAILRARLLDRYLEVIEGQYLDFTLAATELNDPSVTEETYLTMTNKKTARLVRAATEASPILAKKGEIEIAALGDFGENLGMAYQLYDDWQGIWGVSEKTGKQRSGDIYERKKTLPVIYAREHLAPTDRQRLEVLYDKGTPDKGEVEEILGLLAKTDAQKVLESYAMRYKEAAIRALTRTELTGSTKILLEQVTRALVPDVVIASR